jgi:hypothetical protein
MAKDGFPISTTALKAKELSPDGKGVIISLTTRYSAAERQYSVPLECLYDFVVDLQRLNAFAGRATTETAVRTMVTPNDPAISTETVRPIQSSTDKPV